MLLFTPSTINNLSLMAYSKPVMTLLLVLAIGCLSFALVWGNLNAEEPPIYALKPGDPDVVLLGQEIYVQHCAACHGDDLEGQPNWRIRDENWLLPAPPHDESGHTWHHADEVLFLSVKLGQPNSYFD